MKKRNLIVFWVIFIINLIWFYSGTPVLIWKSENLIIPPPIEETEAATSVFVGEFPSSSTSSLQLITNVGFQPKAVIFFWTTQTSHGFTTPANFGVGFSSGPTPTSSRAIAHCSESTNAGGNSDTTTYISSSTIVILTGNGTSVAGCGTLSGKATLKTMDASGFTLFWTTTSTSNYLIKYFAIGGADITSSTVGSFTMNNTVGSQQISTLGFKPDFLMVMSANTTTTYEMMARKPGHSFSIGFSTNTTSTQAGIGINSEYNQTTADTVSIASTTDALIQYYAVGAPAAIDGKAMIASLDSSGFTMMIKDGTTATPEVFYLALQGGNFYVDNFLQATSTGNQTISGVGFQPVGVFMMSNSASSTPFSQKNDAVLSLGATYTATSSMRQIGFADIDGDSTPDPDVMSTSTNLITMLAPVAGASPVVAAQANLQSFNSDGFVMNWTRTNNTVRSILYWAIGNKPAVTISCSTDQTSTSFETLTDSAISTSTPNASTTMSCDGASGCTLYINDSGSNGSSTVRAGLYNSTSTALIESPNGSFSASTTLSAGTEGYGIRATTTSAGSGGTLSINLRYNTGAAQGLLGSINDVGGLSTTTITLASSTSAVTNREIVVTHKAAISSVTPSGNYNDVITYSCVSN